MKMRTVKKFFELVRFVQSIRYRGGDVLLRGPWAGGGVILWFGIDADLPDKFLIDLILVHAAVADDLLPIFV